MMDAEIQKKFDQVQVGDILVGCYSYNMTFYDFFEVRGKTKSSLKLQKLDKKSLPGNLYEDPVVPIFNKYDGDIITRRVSKYGYMMENGEYSMGIRIDSKYDPKKRYCQNHMD